MILASANVQGKDEYKKETAKHFPLQDTELCAIASSSLQLQKKKTHAYSNPAFEKSESEILDNCYDESKNYRKSQITQL